MWKWEWFLSYLSERTQQVTFDVVNVTLSVPQGSFSGRLLFIVIVNDIMNFLSSTFDLKIHRIVKDSSHSLKLQADLKCLNKQSLFIHR